MKETLSNIWFVVFVLLFVDIQLFCIAIEIYIKERSQELWQAKKQTRRKK